MIKVGDAVRLQGTERDGIVMDYDWMCRMYMVDFGKGKKVEWCFPNELVKVTETALSIVLLLKLKVLQRKHALRRA